MAIIRSLLVGDVGVNILMMPHRCCRYHMCDFDLNDVISLRKDRLHRYYSTDATRPKLDLYKALNLKRTATAKEVKSAYFSLSKVHHPDTATGEGSAEKFQEITDAYEILGNAEKRAAYDRELRTSERSNADAINYHFDARQWTGDDSERFRSTGAYSGFDGSPPSSTKGADGYPPGFDMDYKNFIEFQRRMRNRKTMNIGGTYVPPEFWDDIPFMKSAASPKTTPSFYHERWQEQQRKQKTTTKATGFAQASSFEGATEYKDGSRRVEDEMKLAAELRRRRLREQRPSLDELMNNKTNIRQVRGRFELAAMVAMTTFGVATALALVFMPSK